jgi:hypothetical protein
MKRANLFSVIILSVMIFATSTSMSAEKATVLASGNSQTELGEYQITELEPEIIKNETLRKFQLNYENGSAPITILLKKHS